MYSTNRFKIEYGKTDALAEIVARIEGDAVPRLILSEIEPEGDEAGYAMCFLSGEGRANFKGGDPTAASPDPRLAKIGGIDGGADVLASEIASLLCDGEAVILTVLDEGEGGKPYARACVCAKGAKPKTVDLLACAIDAAKEQTGDERFAADFTPMQAR